MNKKLVFLLVLALVVSLSCNALTPAVSPTPDLLATLKSSTPLALTQLAGSQGPTGPQPTPFWSTPVPTGQIPPSGSPAPSALPLPLPLPLGSPIPSAAPPSGSHIPGPTGGVPGKIVFTCQVFKVQASNQICIINADGTGFKRLTTDNNRQHYYGSLAPDGNSVLYAAFREANVYEIYEMALADGSVKQLTNRLGVLNAPEISPDGSQIIFMHWIAETDRYEVWVMGRDGKNPHRLIDMTAWDPTWSPDGKQVLFASNKDGTNQLYVANLDGSGLRKVSSLPAIRGRSDWSPDGKYIVTYSGEPWQHEVFLMNADGSNSHQVSPAGGNAQGAAFSADGQWLAFTAYYGKMDDIHGCEIYIMRIDGTDLHQLTSNDYCDYQPRWGP